MCVYEFQRDRPGRFPGGSDSLVNLSGHNGRGTQSRVVTAPVQGRDVIKPTHPIPHKSDIIYVTGVQWVVEATAV